MTLVQRSTKQRVATEHDRELRAVAGQLRVAVEALAALAGGDFTILPDNRDRAIPPTSRLPLGAAREGPGGGGEVEARPAAAAGARPGPRARS